MISPSISKTNTLNPFHFAVILSVIFILNTFSVIGQNSIHVGLIYPISNHGIQARSYSNVFSLHAIAGASLAEKGLSIAGVTNVIKENAVGLQVAGVSNHVGGSSQGLLVGGIINTYDIGNGFQVAGIANLARQEVKGWQLSGIVNTAQDVDGVQIAGLVNKAKKVKGVQLAGLINIADSSDYPIGLVNIIKNGEKSIGLSIDESQTTLATFRSGGKVLYGIIGGGYNFQMEDKKYALEGGIGAHFGQGTRFRVNAEAITLSLFNFKKGHYSRSALRLLPAFKLNPKLEVFAGPTFNFVQTNNPEAKSLTKHYLWDRNSSRNLNGLYIGSMGGLHWTL